MKKFLLIGFLVLFSMNAFAMVEIDQNPIRADIPSWNQATIYWAMFPTNINDSGTRMIAYITNVLSISSHEIYIVEGATPKLKFKAQGSLLGGTDGIWSTPIDNNTFYYCSLKYDYTSDESYDPVIYCNGKLMSITEESTPESLVIRSSENIYFGGTNTSTNLFSGEIGEIGIIPVETSDLFMKRITASRLARIISFYMFSYYIPLDDYKSGTIISEFTEFVGHQYFLTFRGTFDVNTTSGINTGQKYMSYWW